MSLLTPIIGTRSCPSSIRNWFESESFLCMHHQDWFGAVQVCGCEEPVTVESVLLD